MWSHRFLYIETISVDLFFEWISPKQGCRDQNTDRNNTENQYQTAYTDVFNVCVCVEIRAISQNRSHFKDFLITLFYIQIQMKPPMKSHSKIDFTKVLKCYYASSTRNGIVKNIEQNQSYSLFNIKIRVFC